MGEGLEGTQPLMELKTGDAEYVRDVPLATAKVGLTVKRPNWL
jgi:hypothetical protein